MTTRASLSCDLLGPVLRDPSRISQSSPAEWELLMRQARAANLLARLALRLEESKPPSIHAQLQAHLKSACLMAKAQQRAVHWEAREIGRALRELGGPVVLLKGAAYAMAGLPPAKGRVFSDIDLLVPKQLLGQAEAALMLGGWHHLQQDPYDDLYYRRWMHEVPPMIHASRETVVDLHHNILPPTSRMRVDANRLLDAIVPLPDWPGLFRLGDADLVLHSASHLFLDGEFDKGLRDLVDLDALLRHFGSTQPGFWMALVERAQLLGLDRVLFYALRYAQTVLETPVAAEATQALAAAAPPTWQLAWMDMVFHRALRPDHPSCSDTWSGVARNFLYLRAHWMRMPLHLLLPHLTIKAWKRRFVKDASEVSQ